MASEIAKGIWLFLYQALLGLLGIGVVALIVFFIVSLISTNIEGFKRGLKGKDEES